MTTYEGQLQGEGTRVAVVCSRFNEMITERLLSGAIDGLRTHGVDDSSITIARVPGAFELPLAAARLAGSGEYDAIVCLGAVIRGATGHYEQVAGQCAAGIQRAQMDTGVPVIFGVLTTDTVEQALERAGVDTGESTAGDYERREHAAPVGDRGSQQTGVGLGGTMAGEYLRQEHAGPGDMASQQAGSSTRDFRADRPAGPPAQAPGDSTAVPAGTPAQAPGDSTAVPAGPPEQAFGDSTAVPACTRADRAGPPENPGGAAPLSNKGYEAALAALEMCDLLRQLPKSPRA